MISRSLILQILQAAKIMRRFFYEAPAEIMRNYTTCVCVYACVCVREREKWEGEKKGSESERI